MSIMVASVWGGFSGDESLNIRGGGGWEVSCGAEVTSSTAPTEIFGGQSLTSRVGVRQHPPASHQSLEICRIRARLGRIREQVAKLVPESAKISPKLNKFVPELAKCARNWPTSQGIGSGRLQARIGKTRPKLVDPASEFNSTSPKITDFGSIATDKQNGSRVPTIC